MFQIDFSGCQGAFGVPNDVVDKHLNLSGALSLKVLLLLLRHGRPMSAGELATLLNQTEGDVRDALNHWIQLGLVAGSANEPVAHPSPAVLEAAPVEAIPVVAAEPAPKAEPKPQPEPEPQEKSPGISSPPQVQVEPFVPRKKEKAAESQKEEAAQPAVRMERFRRMNRHDVLEIAQQDGAVPVLVEESQNILGRPLSNGESEMLVSFYHYYGLGIDILLMLLTYCKSIGKDSAGYIEKVAADWVNREINTHERAEQELLRLTEKDEDEQTIRDVFGIYGRGVTKRERDYYATWRGEFGFDVKMIALAGERTVDQKGELNFAYTNGILRAWNEKNIRTPAQAEQETNDRNGRQNGGNGGNGNQAQGASNTSYDLDKLEDMITHGSVWD